MSEQVSRELAESRWRKLQGLLRQRGILRVEELAAALGVSAATVRRDLAALLLFGGERAVGLVDALELFFRAFLEAQVGMVATRQASIRGLDFSLVGPAMHTEDCVVLVHGPAFPAARDGPILGLR